MSASICTATISLPLHAKKARSCATKRPDVEPMMGFGGGGGGKSAMSSWPVGGAGKPRRRGMTAADASTGESSRSARRDVSRGSLRDRDGAPRRVVGDMKRRARAEEEGEEEGIPHGLALNFKRIVAPSGAYRLPENDVNLLQTYYS